ncbi:hypothetical protein M0R45_005778 [Rubus argutus]|uniref:Uncharacterized protein n=1 Tax=Rubus argutus TaxID=59490 RepID=A0AAW1YNL8_RUBAR
MWRHCREYCGLDGNSQSSSLLHLLPRRVRHRHHRSQDFSRGLCQKQKHYHHRSHWNEILDRRLNNRVSRISAAESVMPAKIVDDISWANAAQSRRFEQHQCDLSVVDEV